MWKPVQYFKGKGPHVLVLVQHLLVRPKREDEREAVKADVATCAEEHSYNGIGPEQITASAHLAGSDPATETFAHGTQ
ncbi:hypothetical protein N7534_003562 [Penicillium rubens]|nr:hypothetical protein N7524_003627 [Penicillium chrysogenum]KAJ5858285.1 hypothetical protein N7534_003562 [Penicillium rubens]